jgi:hypothetical protein
VHHSRIAQATAIVASVLVGLSPLRAATVATDTSQIHGYVVVVHGNSLTLRLRDGRQTKVDITHARASHHTGSMPVGGAVVVYGTRGADGGFHAISIGHANPHSKSWPPDD